MKKSTTIAISKKVQKKLIALIHCLENKQMKRFSYSDAIDYLINKVKEK